jgi:exopolyphosphatase/guanosine-5'-triphosphate,3'-diphosphate pyrophosphatase
MLAADITDGCLRIIMRERVGTRLFAGLGADGMLDPRSMEAALEAVSAFHKLAQAAGAEDITVFATSAVRDAANRDAFCEAVFTATRMSADILSGETEAELSFLGACGGSGYAGMIDIGGGSTETAIGYEGDIICSNSLQAGAVRLNALQSIACPKDAEDVLALVFDMTAVLTPPQTAQPIRWTGVGGTLTTLAAVIHQVEWTDDTSVHGLDISRDDAWAAALRLAAMTPAARQGVPGMRPDRADILIHGTCILTACMRRLNIGRIRVSENSNLDGYLMRRHGIGETRG